MSMYTSDLLRSGFFILAVAGILWALKEKKLQAVVATVLVGTLMVADLYLIDRNYVNKEDFVNAREVDTPFQPTQADSQILQDKSFYRVYEPQLRLQGRTSFFHNSVGGYSAVRPRRMDQLFNYIVDPQIRDMIDTIDPEEMALGKEFPVLNLLNVKYMILQAGEGQDVSITNPYANGAAWFVQDVKTVNTADEELLTLEQLDSKNEVVVNKKDLPDTLQKTTFVKDSTASITLKLHEPNHIQYTSSNKNEGLAVFSEMYYADGWNAYIDGKNTPHFKADFVLRAMTIPAGKHTIEFKFEPQVVKTGSTIALISFILVVLLLLLGIYISNKNKSNPEFHPAKNN